MQSLVFLLDVDNTLLDNDAIKEDWAKQLQAMVGPALARRLWEIYEQVRREREVVDIPLASSRLREEAPLTDTDQQPSHRAPPLFQPPPLSTHPHPPAPTPPHPLPIPRLTLP